MKLENIHQYGRQLEEYLKLKTFSLGVKLLSDEKEPVGIKRPNRDLGYHLSLCQCFALSRREGIALAMFIDDMWCFEPVIGLGLAEAPSYFLDGHKSYPGTAKTLEAGKKWAELFPHFTTNQYKGIAFAPLSKIGFEPEIVLLYCSPFQLTQLMMAVNWIDGNDINCRLSGSAACVYAIVQVIQNNQFQVSIPCIGDRKRAIAQDDEMIFSFPIKKLELLVKGLEALMMNNLGLPIKFSQMPEYKLPESFIKIARLMGMDI